MTEAGKTSGRFGSPKRACDLVMKGGLTSGVVYPGAILKLAEEYRFVSIGGTSAGAIAAAATAAAEYGRASSGFEALADVSKDLGKNLQSLFQPKPALKPLFNVLLALLNGRSRSGKLWKATCAAVRGYPLTLLIGLIPSIAALAAALMWKTTLPAVLLAATLAVVGAMAALVYGLARSIFKDIPRNDYGICPGIQQSGNSQPAFMDWISDLIDRAAGLSRNEQPLTFGMLEKPKNGHSPITLSMVTTNLTMRRPYTLPFQSKEFFFREADMSKVLPKRVVDYLLSVSEPLNEAGRENMPPRFYYVPTLEKLPVAFAVRLSLSFPALITAVPLYARDFTQKEQAHRDEPLRNYFSDGGLSSNFPIHFFDSPWPVRPTFGIALEDHDPLRNRSEAPWMPTHAGAGMLIPGSEFGGLFGFLKRLVDAAKDWQDNLQSLLPGYRERIVHVPLQADEGGTNLSMSADTITALVAKGDESGKAIIETFDFDEHRWRRFLVAMSSLGEKLAEMRQAYLPPAGVDKDTTESFRDFLARYPSKAQSYQQSKLNIERLLKRAEAAAALGKDWSAPSAADAGPIPKPKGDIRITPQY